MKYLRMSDVSGHVRPVRCPAMSVLFVRAPAPAAPALEVLQLLYEGMAEDGSQRIVPESTAVDRPQISGYLWFFHTFHSVPWPRSR